MRMIIIIIRGNLNYEEFSAAGVAAAVIASPSAREAAETESRRCRYRQGQKIDQALTDVAASVEVVTAEEIAREPVSDVYDIVERIPNVTTSFGDLGFAIRGIDQRGVGGSGRGQTLTVYVDDASLGNYTTFFGPLDSWDLGRVEVYRGPQSTNFGRNALAGAIYVRTQDPTYEPDFRRVSKPVNMKPIGLRQLAEAQSLKISLPIVFRANTTLQQLYCYHDDAADQEGNIGASEASL